MSVYWKSTQHKLKSAHFCLCFSYLSNPFFFFALNLKWQLIWQATITSVSKFGSREFYTQTWYIGIKIPSSRIYAVKVDPFFFLYRTVLSFVSGIYVYVVAWGLLGQDGGDNLGRERVTQFAVGTWIKWRYGNCVNEQSNLIDWINDDDEEIEFIIPYCSGAQPNARFLWCLHSFWLVERVQFIF